MYKSFKEKARKMSEWYHLKEQSAGKYRLLFLWWVYKLIGLQGLKVILYPIVRVISFFCTSAKKHSQEYRGVLYEYNKKHGLPNVPFSDFRHILNYAYSLADKMSAICDKDTPIKFKIEKDDDWFSFQENIKRGRGIFLISSHLGNIEAFCAFSDSEIKSKTKLHALMEISQNSIFHNFIQARTLNDSFRLYSTEKLDFQTIMFLYENLCEGDIILMAGDRVSAENREKTISGKMLYRQCLFPEGTFLFSKKMKHPTYAIVLLYIGHNTYKISLKKIDTSKSIEDMVTQYTRFIEANIIKYPAQWYNFFSFFK